MTFKNSDPKYNLKSGYDSVAGSFECLIDDMFQSPDPLKEKLLVFGGGGGDTQDEEYNSRMATIAEANQDIANDLANFYRYGSMEGHWETLDGDAWSPTVTQTITEKVLIDGDGEEDDYYDYVTREETVANTAEKVWVPENAGPSYLDMEKAQIEDNIALLGYQTEDAWNDLTQKAYLRELEAKRIRQATELMPGETALAHANINDSLAAINERAPVRAAFYEQSLNGVNVESRANQAAADAAQAFMNSNNIAKRDAARMGVDPNSGRFAATANQNAIERSKAIGSAKSTARNSAESENYQRLTTAMNYGGTA